MRTYILALMFVSLTAVVWSAPSNEAIKRIGLLKAALESADRLEIRDTAGWVDDKGKPVEPGPCTVIERPHVATEFLQFCVLSDGDLLPPCCCEGEIRVAFFCGSKKLAELYFHEGFAIDWRGGSLDGFVPVTPDSKKALRQWFREHGAAREVARIKE